MKSKFRNIILLIAAWLQVFTGCYYSTYNTYQTETIIEKPSGIYVGAISFDRDTQNITGEKLVYLNHEGSLFLARAIINRYKTSNHQNISHSRAVEQAVSAINSNSEYFPSDLESVDIIVISDKETSKNPSLPEMKAVGKNINVHHFNANKEIGEIHDIAQKFTNSFSKSSSVVYIVLDAAPENEFNAIKIQFSAVAILDALTDRFGSATSTPLIKVFVDEKNPKTKVDIKWYDSFINWVVVTATIGIIALVVILAMNADQSENDN